MAEDRSHSECEDASSQWDVVSISGFSESDSGLSAVGEQGIAEVEVNFDHFNCPTLSSEATALDNLTPGDSSLWEALHIDQVEADNFPAASISTPVAHPVKEDDEEAINEGSMHMEEVLAMDTSSIPSHPPFHAESITSILDPILPTLVEEPDLDQKDRPKQADLRFPEFEKGKTLQNLMDRNNSAEKCELEPECEAWWMHQALSWKNQARQANCVWSLALAAALMGLAVLGQRWQHERYQNQQLRLQLSAKEKKVNQLLLQVSRLKRTMSSRRRVQVHRGRSCYYGLNDCF